MTCGASVCPAGTYATKKRPTPWVGSTSASVTQGTMRASPARNGSSEARAPFATRSARFTTARLLSPNAERPGGTLRRLW